MTQKSRKEIDSCSDPFGNVRSYFHFFFKCVQSSCWFFVWPFHLLFLWYIHVSLRSTLALALSSFLSVAPPPLNSVFCRPAKLNFWYHSSGMLLYAHIRLSCIRCRFACRSWIAPRCNDFAITLAIKQLLSASRLNVLWCEIVLLPQGARQQVTYLPYANR